MYIKENGVIYRVTATRTVVDLEALRAKLTDLKAMKEPKDAELIELGKMIHTYYADKEIRIPELEKLIGEIEEGIK